MPTYSLLIYVSWKFSENQIKNDPKKVMLRYGKIESRPFWSWHYSKRTLTALRKIQTSKQKQFHVHNSYKTSKSTKSWSSNDGFIGESMDLSRILLAVKRVEKAYSKGLPKNLHLPYHNSEPSCMISDDGWI